MGLVLRLAAAWWSTGYLMHDDHFLVVEVGASWSDGEDYNNWLPWNQAGTPEPKPGNFAYPGLQMLLFDLLDWTGPSPAPDDGDPPPPWTLRLPHHPVGVPPDPVPRAGRKSLATTTAWLLAAGGFWPLISVHQLVEVVCIPPLLLCFWLLAKRDRLDWRDVMLAGVGLGIATGLRFQCGLIGLGLIPVFLAERNPRTLLGLGLTALSTFALMQSPDLFIWGEPFVQLRGYIAYNAEHAGEYPSGPWYQYGLTLLGLLVPPVSLMLLWGALHPGRSAVPTRWWRIAIPVLVFSSSTACFQTSRNASSSRSFPP